ncbi:MAG: cell division protein FtsZ [Pseudomonadota bacterium]
MTINLSMPTTPAELKPRITVIGIGGAGGNAVNNMIRAKLDGVDFVVANTDAQALSQTLAERRVQLGLSVTQGLGAGSRPDIGRAACEEAINDIAEHLAGSHMAFIAAGMGGGTGTGGAPVIARAAREHGILTVGVITKPFHFEGQHRMRIAEAGIDELQKVVDTLIIIPNQNLFRVANERTTFADAFKMADDVLYSGVRGVTDLIVMPGLINLDFADIRTVMSEMGKAMMGTGEAEGDNRALDAAQKAISNPLLDDVSMKGARGVLINITGGPDMTLFEVDEAANRIRDEVDPDANIIFGSTFDESLTGKMRITVVSTGIDALAHAEPRPTVISLVSSRPAARPGLRTAGSAALKSEEQVATPALVAAVAVAPAAGALAPEPTGAVAPATVASATAVPAAEAGASFIAPQPVEPTARPARVEAGKAADPFAAAAMENAPPPVKERHRGPSLFERVTGTGRARSQAAEPTPARVIPPAAPAPVPVQPRRGGLDAADRIAPAKIDDDLLDIPAFLRRQAN